MRKHSANTNTKVRAAVAGMFFLATLYTLFYAGDLAGTVYSQTRRRPAAAPVKPPRYSAFPHDTKSHRVECSSCHKFPSANWNKVRTGDAAIPDITEYPNHESCIGCHRQQFFRGARPAICSICHVNPGPRTPGRHAFPNPRELFDATAKGKSAESDFAIGFPHDKHIDIVSRRTGGAWFQNASFARADENCAVCHTTIQPQGDSSDEFLVKPPATLGDAFWLKKGTFKSSPIGHTTCFTCHSQDSGLEPTPANCAACHKLRQPLPAADFDPKLAAQMGATTRVMTDAWKRRDSAGTFRHEFSSHAELSCDTCHNVKTINTLDAKTKVVPISSCAMCHVTATVDDGGVLNFELQQRKANAAFQCTKCHVTFGKLPVPQSHTQAVIEAGGKP